MASRLCRLAAGERPHPIALSLMAAFTDLGRALSGEIRRDQGVVDVLRRAVVDRRFAPPRSVLDGLIASGRLELIADPRVREGLMLYGLALERRAFPGLADRVRDDDFNNLPVERLMRSELVLLGNRPTKSHLEHMIAELDTILGVPNR